MKRCFLNFVGIFRNYLFLTRLGRINVKASAVCLNHRMTYFVDVDQLESVFGVRQMMQQQPPRAEPDLVAEFVRGLQTPCGSGRSLQSCRRTHRRRVARPGDDVSRVRRQGIGATARTLSSFRSRCVDGARTSCFLLNTTSRM